MRAEAQRVIDEYLPGRRNFLFKSSRAKLMGDPIPPAQPQDVTLAFDQIDAGSNELEQFIALTNKTSLAVDITDWRLAGAGITHRFRPGTVIPSGKAIYVAANVRAFRQRAASPRAGQGGKP
jgi:hypothetical protein